MNAKVLLSCLFSAVLMSGCATDTLPAPDETYSNVLKWKTASEVSNLGFDIYRATDPDGPFERVTPSMLSGAGTSDLINEYRFEDTQIDPHTTYYYYIESISTDGVRRRFSPIRTAAAKIGSGPD